MLIKYITKNYKQTQRLGKNFAEEILKMSAGKTAVVLGLKGNLGGGKTTFLQGFARGIGIKEKILSPTFVVLKHFKIPQKNANYSLPTTNYTDFYHIDCYRINKPKEILELGFKEIISDPKNIVAIEWPEKIKKVLSRLLEGSRGSSTKSGPKSFIKINFKFIDKNTREIIFKM